MKTKINYRTFKLKRAMFAAAVATLFAVPIANAARVWVGGTGGNETNFNTAANWSPSGIPVAADDLTINAGATFYPNVTGASTARTIIIASGASLTISAGSLTIANNAGVTNSGTFTISGTGSLLGDRNLTNNAGGRVSFASSGSSAVRIFTNNSSVTGPDGATISAGTVTLSNSTTNTGTFSITAGTCTISSNSPFTNNGTVTISGGVLQWATTGGSSDYLGTGTTAMTGGLLKFGHNYQANQLNASGGTVEFQVGTGIGNLPVGGSYQFYNVQIDGGNFLSNPTTFSVAGDWDNRVAGQTLDGGSTAIFNGSNAQTIGSTESTTFGNVTVNNSNGVSLSKDTTVEGALLFTSGNITTGAHTLTSGRDNAHLGTVSASASGYVAGNLKKFVQDGSNPTTFEIGTASFYTPITLHPVGNIGGTGGTSGGQSALLARSTAGEHASISSAGINSARDVNSYWSLTPVGDTTWTIQRAGYTVTGIFPSGDIDAGANTAAFIIRRFLSPSWAASPDGTGVTRTPTSTQATVSFGGTTNSTLAFGDFAVGESGTGVVSANADLSNLTLSAGTLVPAFDANTLSYTASVSNATTSITETPTTADATATVTVNGTPVVSGNPSGSIALTVGPNVITTVVTAQDGTTMKTYTATVTRAASANADLSNLTLSAGTLAPAFDANTLSYTASVSNATASITETPTATDANATITVNGSPVVSGTASGSNALVVGPNVITTVVTAPDGTTTKTYTVTVTRAASANADLSNLTLSAGTLTPAFDSVTLSYTASVSNATTSITETPTVADATATVTVNGTPVVSGNASGSIALAVGPNVITTVVTAEDSTMKTYTVTVTRAASANADLSNLTLSAGTLAPAFNGSILSYTASVSNVTTSITETPTAADANATITVNGSPVVSGTASGSIALAIGPNTVTTVATAQDGTTMVTYTVTVTRAASANADLSDLTLSDGTLTPAFDSTTLSYTASVPNATSSITETPTAADANATMTVNGSPVASGSTSQSISLSVGSNVITTVVTAQDGTTMKTYTVDVTRAAHLAPVVTNTNDSGVDSLRQALLEAEDGDTITFNIPTGDPGYSGGVWTITLTTGELVVDKEVVINGLGANVLIVRRDPNASAFRIFNVNSGLNTRAPDAPSVGSTGVTIEGMTISNGLASGSFPADAGGGIYNDHTNLTVHGCALSENSALTDGGGIFNDGSASGNATLTVTASTLSGNSAGFGGGIYNDGTGGTASLTITNSTLSGNSATSNAGGAVVNDGQSGSASLTITSSTLSGNSATNGGGIFNQAASVTLGNTILKTGASGVNIVNNGGPATSSGYNLSNDDGGGFLTATGDQINTDPILGPLKDNGGPTLTHAPLSNSPAIDMGKDIGATGVGQRGDARPVTYDVAMTPPAGGDRSDIGAVELAPGVQPISVVSRKTHGAAGDFDINLSLSGAVTGIECRSGGATNDYKVVLTFASPVNFSSAAVNDGAGSVAGSSGSGTTTVTVDLTGVTSQQIITLALFDANDGTNSGDLGVRMGVLIGDTNNNGSVNAGDVAQTKARSGQSVSGSNFRNDVTANGSINAGDAAMVKSKSGNVLP